MYYWDSEGNKMRLMVLLKIQLKGVFQQ